MGHYFVLLLSSTLQYSGPFCEYKGDAPKCSLQCKNGGECRHGVNYKFEGGITEKFDLGDAFKQGHINFEYCSCPGKYRYIVMGGAYWHR